MAFAPPSPSGCTTAHITEWSHVTQWFSLLYILNMDEDVIITLSVFMSVANVNSNNSCSLPDDWTATWTPSPAVTPLCQQPLCIYTEGRNSILNVWYIFNSNLWEIIIWKVCPQSSETFLKLQAPITGRALLTSSTGMIQSSGAPSVPDAPGISSPRAKQLSQSWLTSR